ncbi:hypothetical protein BDW69DRAFT_176186 [Aspergillus filifer]
MEYRMGLRFQFTNLLGTSWMLEGRNVRRGDAYVSTYLRIPVALSCQVCTPTSPSTPYVAMCRRVGIHISASARARATA